MTLPDITIDRIQRVVKEEFLSRTNIAHCQYESLPVNRVHENIWITGVIKEACGLLH